MSSRRRALIAAQTSDPWTPVSGLTWTIGHNIANGGTKPDAVFAAYSSSVMVAGATVERTGSGTDSDGVEILCYLHEYKGAGDGKSSDWLRRTKLDVGDHATVGADCTNFRFTFAYGSNSGKTMTQTIIDNYFGAKYKEG